MARPYDIELVTTRKEVPMIRKGGLYCTRLDETIMVLIAAEAERKGAAVGFRMMISPEGRAIAGLKEISSSS